MKRASSRALAVCLALATAPPAAAAGPVDARTAYGLAKAAAVKWQPDAELFDLSTLSTAPLDAEGRSAEWAVKWSSKKAGKVNMMSVKNGALTTFEIPTAGGRTIVLSPESILDSKKLLVFHVGIEANGGKTTVLSN